MSIGVICGYSASVISVAPTPLSSSCLCVVVVTPSATPQNCSAALQNILTPNSQVLTSLPRNLSNAIRGVGIEPTGNNAKTLEYTHGSGAEPPASVTKNVKRMVSSDLRLAAIIGAWPSLPEAVKAGIAAMVAASK